MPGAVYPGQEPVATSSAPVATTSLPFTGATSACTWPVVKPTNCDPCPSDPSVLATDYHRLATDYLSAWTGGVFGLCETTVRPCRSDCAGITDTFWGRGPSPGASGGYLPVLVQGEWHNIGCFSCGTSVCRCEATHALSLPGPVHAVTEVRIDGQVLDPSAYRVDNRRYLVRLDGQAWPTCQDMDADPATDLDTFEVTYDKGLPVPHGGQVAAGVLACELAKAACGDSTCALPKRVQTITRQGVTVAMLDAFDDIDTGHTGIWLIDSWVASVTKAPKRAVVASPDYPRRRR